MPSRKQRRRRAKERRHEYEYVYVDEEGREVDVAPEDEPPAKRDGRKQDGRPAGGRRVDPPSWRRVARRGLIFAPIMFLTVSLLNSDLPVGAQIVQTLVLLAFFLPFSYGMDALLYRAYVKRGGEGGASRR